MRLALTNPTNWPSVRRGTERFINELGGYLVAQGHDVTLVSAHNGPAGTLEATDGFRTRLYRRLWHPVFARWGVLEFYPFFFTTLWDLLRHRYDAVLCCTFMDAFAAILARPFTGTPCIFWVNGLPPRVKYIRSVSSGGRIFAAAVRRSDAVIAFSGYVDEYLLSRWQRSSRRIAIPVDVNTFRMGGKKLPRRIICAAALDDERKGGRPLMHAFNQLKGRYPDVLLQIAYKLSPTHRQELEELVDRRWRADVQFLDTKSEELPELFAQASVSVLPAVWEPYGLVILESMASGTPVVATRDGGIPDLITDPRTGVLFDPGEVSFEVTNIAGLAAALEEGLRLAADPTTATHCRKHAEQFSFEALGPEYQKLFAELTAA